MDKDLKLTTFLLSLFALAIVVGVFTGLAKGYLIMLIHLFVFVGVGRAIAEVRRW